MRLLPEKWATQNKEVFCVNRNDECSKTQKKKRQGRICGKINILLPTYITSVMHRKPGYKPYCCMFGTYMYLYSVAINVYTNSITRALTFCEPGDSFSPVDVENLSGAGGLLSRGELN